MPPAHVAIVAASAEDCKGTIVIHSKECVARPLTRRARGTKAWWLLRKRPLRLNRVYNAADSARQEP